MKFGACIGLSADNIEIIKNAGYDYAEISAGDVGLADEEKFNAFFVRATQIGLPVEAANCFIPGHIRLVGKERDERKIKDYLSVLMPRLEQLGVKTVVFGSGGARQVPEGVSESEATEQLAYFLREQAGPAAAKHGVWVAIEPLRAKESNIINFVTQGVELARRVNLPNVKTLADIYHMHCGSEPFEHISQFPAEIIHAHISMPAGRDNGGKYPLPDDEYNYIPFLSAIKAAGCERCSVEGRTDDLITDAPLSLKVLRNAIK